MALTIREIEIGIFFQACFLCLCVSGRRGRRFMIMVFRDLWLDEGDIIEIDDFLDLKCNQE